MADVVLKNIKKVYPNIEPKKKKKGEPEKEKKNNLLVTEEGVLAVHDFNLEIKDNEFIVLVGPSGCGKSTTLRMIAGLEEISGGELYIDGKLMNDIPPKDRDIAMVFQNYALYPHMTVYENMAFGLKLRHVDPQEIDRKVKEAAEILDITQYLDRKPKALSGGQRQRVAIGRAIVRSPKVFLMDEPLSNLDAKLRNQMRAEIIKLRQRIDTTFIYVTHDQTEAMAMADQIVLMDKGRIMQEASPEVIYHDPNNAFTAQFIGTPPMNILPMGEDKLGFRPERVQLGTQRLEGAPFVRKGHILTREMLGSDTTYKIQMGDEAIMVKSPDDTFQYDQDVVLSVRADDLYFFDKDGQRIRRGDVSNYDQYIQRAGGNNNA